METIPIEPPIVVSESGDVEVFQSIEAAESYLESTDVEANRYVAYDKRGRLLRLVPTTPRITITPAEENASHDRELRDLLADYLVRSGVNSAWVERAPLQALVAKSSEYSVVSVGPLEQVKLLLKRVFKRRYL